MRSPLKRAERWKLAEATRKPHSFATPCFRCLAADRGPLRRRACVCADRTGLPRARGRGGRPAGIDAARPMFERSAPRRYGPDRFAAETRHVQPYSALAPRELHVFRLVANGETNRAIASQLSLSEKKSTGASATSSPSWTSPRARRRRHSPFSASSSEPPMRRAPGGKYPQHRHGAQWGVFPKRGLLLLVASLSRYRGAERGHHGRRQMNKKAEDEEARKVRTPSASRPVNGFGR